MTYALTLLYVAMIYIRPGEIVPGLAGVPLLPAVVGAAVVAAVAAMLTAPRRFAELPNDWCYLGFIAAGVLSLPANGWFGGGYVAFMQLLPLLVLYLLVRISVQSERQLRGLVVLLVWLSLFQAANGIVQHWTGVGFGQTVALDQYYEDGSDDLMGGRHAEVVKRIRGTGIFGDPNDLAMSLVIVMPFLFGPILARDRGFSRRVLALGALGILLYALFLTQSRGGLLGLALMGAAYAYRRFGGASVLVAVAASVLLIVAGSGRLQAMNASEDSAQGRIQAWSAGLDMLKSKPVLGVGYDAYTEHHALVAHNSFVHTVAELGMVGGVCFIGVFYWLFAGTSASRNPAGAALSPLSLEIWASGIALVACACFLSRQYSPVLHIPLALGAAHIASGLRNRGEAVVHTARDWVFVLGLSCGVVVAGYIAVRALASW